MEYNEWLKCGIKRWIQWFGVIMDWWFRLIRKKERTMNEFYIKINSH